MPNTDKTIWKDIKGYEGYYQVNQNGQVKSLARIIVRSDGLKLNIKEKMLTPHKNLSGYLFVWLLRSGDKKGFALHRIVARVFIKNPESKPYINHKNGIKTDNSIHNLEWCTARENTKHALDTGLRQQITRDITNAARLENMLPVLQILQSGFVVKEWESAMAVYKAIGIHYSSISKCANGKRQTAGGYVWRFAA